MPGEERYRPYPFAGGLIYLDVEESPAMRRRAEGTYEPAKVAAVQQLLPRDGTFVDVGANKGDFSLIAARVTGGWCSPSTSARVRIGIPPSWGHARADRARCGSPGPSGRRATRRQSLPTCAAS